jgi:hypothetical protein
LHAREERSAAMAAASRPLTTCREPHDERVPRGAACRRCRRAERDLAPIQGRWGSRWRWGRPRPPAPRSTGRVVPIVRMAHPLLVKRWSSFLIIRTIVCSPSPCPLVRGESVLV